MGESKDKQRKTHMKAAIRKVKSAKDALDAPGVRELYTDFMSRFALCEIGYKSLLFDYRKARNLSHDPNDLKIRIEELRRVLKAYSIELDNETVTLVFDGRNKVGDRKARGLRNSLAHSPNSEAFNELASKKNEIFEAMDLFIQLFDETAYSE